MTKFLPEIPVLDSGLDHLRQEVLFWYVLPGENKNEFITETDKHVQNIREIYKQNT